MTAPPGGATTSGERAAQPSEGKRAHARFEPTRTVSAYFGPAALGAGSGAPARARRLATDALRSERCTEALIDDVALAVSELTTNAVRHAVSAFSLVLEVRRSTVRVAVRDRTPLIAGTSNTDAPEGYLVPQPLHGLGIIAAIAAIWGVEATDDGKVVWAELDVLARAGGPQATG